MTTKYFAQNPIINISRSRFNKNHMVKTTFNAGRLIPLDTIEVLPGQTTSLNTHAVIRMSTPIKPVMDNCFMDIFYFFVPHRLVWDNWKKFMGERGPEAWRNASTLTIPQTFAPSGGWNSGTLADYLGIPTKKGVKVSSLYFRSYAQIYNDWFRDQNNEPFTTYSHGDGNATGSNADWTTPGTTVIGQALLGAACAPVAKPHDYFTSALPEPQKGPDVLLPLGATAPVSVFGNGNNIGLGIDWLDPDSEDPEPELEYKEFGLGADTDSFALSMEEDNYNHPTNPNDGTFSPLGEYSGYYIGLTKNPQNSGIIGTADLSNATAATINQLREAFQLQKMFEKDARGGTRYTEILKNHFGVTSSDARLQRAEYLGGKRIPISIAQVIQTSSTDATTPQGNASAYSLTIDHNHGFTKSFEEHGLIFVLGCVRTKHTYQQGLNKKFSRLNREDFYWPVFANIGEQPIYNKEIYAQGTTVVDDNGEVIDDQVFGYQEAWAEYRYTPDIVTGQMRSNVSGGQDIWHYADYYDSLPVLGADFIHETTANIDRTLAVSSATAHQFIADFYFEEVDTMPMPVYSIPGLIDHH